MSNHVDSSSGCNVNEKNTSAVIFPMLSREWHQRRGKLFSKNNNRNRSVHVDGHLQNNFMDLEKKVFVESNPQRKEKYRIILAVGKYFLQNGPLVSAKELGMMYKNCRERISHKELKRCPKPTELLSILLPYLNLSKVHLQGTAYFIEKRQNLDTVLKKLEDLSKLGLRKHINCHIEREIGGLFNKTLRFADTKKDHDLIKGLFAKATSTNFVAKLSQVKNKNSIMASKNELEANLFQFEDIEKTSQTVRNDMTNGNQRRLYKRIIALRKSKEFRKKFDSRGRALKADIFPELAVVLESIFESGDKGIGGGVESHTRLTTDIAYRSKDNNLFMWQAREILLKVAPPDFSISLSSCYNYTESYKDNTLAAKRHHAGKNINARISFKRPPRDAVSHQVVNLHWSTKAVNLMLEKAEKTPNDHLVD